MKKIAVTMGDPAGVGPEITVRALSQASVRLMCQPVVIGEGRVLAEALKLAASPLKLREIGSPPESRFDRKTIEYIQCGETGKLKIGKPTAEGGRASFGYVERAVRLAMAGEVDAVCTAPISKEALRLAGVPFPGHTEMLAELTGARDVGMMLVGGPLRVLLVTTHVSIAEVPGRINKAAVLKKILLARKAARMLGIKDPSIAVCGLNPHAGEGGLFGREEESEIAPAVAEARKKRVRVTGPHVPDALFRKAYLGEYDILVVMYHDQGLIPLKMIAFDKGVNITVGLPFIRTSPDHGTAFDIAWKGAAKAGSMTEALKYAAGLRPVK